MAPVHAIPTPSTPTIATWKPWWDPDQTDPALPPVTVIHDRHDDRSFMTAAANAHCPALGHLTVHPTPVATAPASLAHDLLRALGKHPPHPTNGPGQPAPWADNTDQAWTAVAAWTHALQITHLLICRAHLISPRHWTHLFALREHTGAHLTLLCHGPLLPALRACLDAVSARSTDRPPAPPSFDATTADSLWWQAANAYPPRADEPHLHLPARSRRPRPSPHQQAAPAAYRLPPPDQNQQETHPALRTAARRIHARIAHPLHAAAVATLVLTGCRTDQLTGPRPATSLASTPRWATPLFTAAHTFQTLRGVPQGPVKLTGLDLRCVEAATAACRLVPHAAGPRRS
ncbi:hypothetical protein [Streptomyces sp. NPDC005096]|uniref:hypothetical protein n=1 Tax=Streptomyces sp. NPDC005096 TaxID=3154559 RepID=UPI0033BD50E2